ncbi:MAG: hypothetical protein K9G62_05680 [Alphaproteobacteria bacterium]|nr:hypothetical protein [Alphaproteobacteria bacterium]
MDPKKIIETVQDSLDRHFNEMSAMGSKGYCEIPNLPLYIQNIEKFSGNFEAVLRNLPDCLEAEIIPNVAVLDKDSTRKKRNAFEQQVKKSFLMRAAEYQKEDFLKMGLGRDEVKSIRCTGKAPAHPDGGYYDLTVDHCVELASGGSSNAKNLTAVPEYINGFRNDFIKSQRQYAPKADFYINIIPRRIKNKLPVVGIFPGGFRQKGPNRFSRTDELFGFPYYDKEVSSLCPALSAHSNP